MARVAVSRCLAWAIEQLGRVATVLLGVLVGGLCAIGVLSLGMLGSLLVAGLATGLGLLAASAWRAGPARPLPELLATPNRVLGLSIGSLALTGWFRVGVYRWGVAAGLAALGVLAWRCAFLLGRRGSATRRRAESRVRARELAGLLGRLPTDVLLAEWDSTGRAVGLHPGLHAEEDLVQLRALLLDELERRDPDGFAAWQHACQQGRRPCAPEEFLDAGA